MLYPNTPYPYSYDNPDAELIGWREKAEGFLLDAYSGEPTVVFWLEKRGVTTDDLEAEIDRLTRAIQGKKVGEPFVDIPRMSKEVDEKRTVLGRLITLESVLEPALRGEKWALEKMLELGYTGVGDLEAEVKGLRAEVGDPPQLRLTDEERGLVAGLIVGEGELKPYQFTRRREPVHKREYCQIYPEIVISSTDEDTIDQLRGLIGGIKLTIRRPSRRDLYRLHIRYGRACDVAKEVMHLLSGTKEYKGERLPSKELARRIVESKGCRTRSFIVPCP